MNDNRSEIFALFRQTVAAWIVCFGRRTISRVWETTGQAEERSHAAAFRLLSVQRATPMAWFVGTLVVCWYVEAGQQGEQAQRHRPWYAHKETPHVCGHAGGVPLAAVTGMGTGREWCGSGPRGEFGLAVGICCHQDLRAKGSAVKSQ